MTSGDRPTLRGGRGNATSAVLLLHGGQEHNTSRTSRRHLPSLRMLDLYAGVRARSRACAVYRLRYRVVGWNAGTEEPDPVVDARWALAQIARRHPELPIALVGHSMGARTAFRIADHPRVVGVCALAPWLPEREELVAWRPDQQFVLAHGTADSLTSPHLSHAYAARLRDSGASVARFEQAAGGHALLNQPALWHRFVVRTSLGLVGDQPMPTGVAKALVSTEPATLRLPLREFG